MSETSDNEKHLLDMSPNVKIITALIVGLLLGAWANDEFDEPKGKFEFMVGGDMLWKVDRGGLVGDLNRSAFLGHA